MTDRTEDFIVQMISVRGFPYHVLGPNKIKAKLFGRRYTTFRIAEDGEWRSLSGTLLADALDAAIDAPA